MYYEEIKADIPELINNVNIINDEIYYLIQLYYMNEEKIKTIDKYEIKFDKYAAITEVRNILHSINPFYEQKFNYYLKNKKIIFGKFNKSCTTNSKMYIKQRNNIEDVFVIIHEFFHFVHLEKYNYNMEDPNWYTLTEMIAINFELYTLINLYNNHMYKEDIRRYILKLIYNIYIRADDIAVEAMSLNIYDKYKKFDTESFYKYKKVKQVPDDFIYLINQLVKKGEPFIYHENATYIYAFPLSIVMATRMNLDIEYFNKVMVLFENINKYSVKEILDILELSYIMSSDDSYENLYQIMTQIDRLIDDIYEYKDVKRIGVKR